MTDEERDQRLRRLRALRDRIAILLLRQAQQGPRMAASEEIELQEAQRAELALTAELGLDVAVPEHVGARTLAERVLAIEYRMKLLEEMVSHALTAINGQLATIRDDAQQWRESERAARIERQEYIDMRLIRIELAVIGLFLGLAGLAGYLVVAVSP